LEEPRKPDMEMLTNKYLIKFLKIHKSEKQNLNIIKVNVHYTYLSTGN